MTDYEHPCPRCRRPTPTLAYCTPFCRLGAWSEAYRWWEAERVRIPSSSVSSSVSSSASSSVSAITLQESTRA